MNMKDAMAQAEKCCEGNDIRSQSALASAAMIADAITRLAKAQEKQADIAEKQWAIASGMMDKMGPMIDKTVEVMNQETEGEDWKRRGSQGIGDDEDNG